MPIAINLEELRPGMRLARTLYSQYSALLTAGVELTSQHIDRLNRLQYDMPILIADPLLDAKIEFEDPTPDQEVARRVHQAVVDTMALVEEAFAKTTVLPPAEFIKLQQSIAEVVRYLEDHPVHGAFLIKATTADDYLRFHCANVFYLSMLVGKRLVHYLFSERLRQTAADRLSQGLDLKPLGVAALLHDIGMLPIVNVWRKRGRLSDDELGQLRGHPSAGRDMLPENTPALVRSAIGRHHERADGSGYPDGRLLRDTPVFARVLRLTDAYDAATSVEMHREARPPVRVLYEMTRGGMRRFFDPTLTKALSDVIQPFPIGARLRLTNGQTAVVVRHNRAEPFAPVVVVAFDAKGLRIPAGKLRSPVDLASQAKLRLASFYREQLSYLYSTTPPIAVSRPADRAASAFELAYP